MNQHQDYDKIFKETKDKTKNKKKLQKLIMQLEILSNLRNLQPEIKKTLTNMSINYDVTKDLRYLEGVEIGIEQGLGKGLEQGVEKTKKEFIIELLRQGVLTLKQIADVAKTDIDTIIVINNEINTK